MTTPQQLSRCPRCDEPLTGNEQVCPSCHRPLAKPTGTPGLLGKPVPCPICKIPLYPASLEGHDVLHCAECEGSGVRRETMMKLQPQGKKEVVIGSEEKAHKTPPFFEPRTKPPFLICPFCGKRMKAVKLGKTELDQCEKCGGIWLEGSKFGALQDIVGPFKWKAIQ